MGYCTVDEVKQVSNDYEIQRLTEGNDNLIIRFIDIVSANADLFMDVNDPSYPSLRHDCAVLTLELLFAKYNQELPPLIRKMADDIKIKWFELKGGKIVDKTERIKRPFPILDIKVKNYSVPYEDKF